jgi:hypothetical protein
LIPDEEEDASSFTEEEIITYGPFLQDEDEDEDENEDEVQNIIEVDDEEPLFGIASDLMAHFDQEEDVDEFSV